MGTVYVVATPIGNLSDITFRAIKVLNEVEYIFAEDTRNILKLLNHYELKKPKLVSLHKYNEVKNSKYLVEKIINENCNVAVVCDAGTPCISDPGRFFISLARKKGLNIIGIPGASALTLSVSISGMNVDRFTFIGFFPRENRDRKEIIELMKANCIKSFVFYESPLRLIDTLKYLCIFFNNAAIMVGNDLTKFYEKSIYGDISCVIDELTNFEYVNKGEYVIVFEPRYEKNENKMDISIEALLFDTMIKNNISLKESIKVLSQSMKLKKNEVYQASLHLKDYLKDK